MHRRTFLTTATVAAAASAFAQVKSGSGGGADLLMPTDTPDAHHFKLMWYNPVPAVNSATWRLKIAGLVEKPQQIALPQLRALPAEKQNSRMKCVQCWSARAEWGGFRYGALADLVKPLRTAKAVRIDCADKWYEYFSIEELSSPRLMFVLDMAGKPLEPNHGAPLRLMDPTKYGYKSAKLVTSITFVEQGKGSMACDIASYYSADGKILSGYDTPLDLDGGKVKRKIAGGEITGY
jgi:methionine sulfoxide reductase catalytic subunit